MWHGETQIQLLPGSLRLMTLISLEDGTAIWVIIRVLDEFVLSAFKMFLPQTNKTSYFKCRLFSTRGTEASAPWWLHSGDRVSQGWVQRLCDVWDKDSKQNRAGENYTWGTSGLILWKQHCYHRPQQWQVRFYTADTTNLVIISFPPVLHLMPFFKHISVSWASLLCGECMTLWGISELLWEKLR